MLKKIGGFKLALLIIVLLAILGYGGYRYYQSKQTAKVEIDTVKVEVGDIATTVSATGTITPVNSVEVNSKITGRIVEVLVRENDWVTEGQPLFILDDEQYRNELSKMQATLNNSALTLERMKTLSARGAVAQQEYDAAEKEYLVASANYDTAVSNLADTVIKAPVTGLVIGKPTPAGQTVSPGISTPMVLMTIADMSIMQSETLVDETDIGRVVLGQKVEFTVDAYDDTTFNGVVSLISRKAQTENNVIYYKVYVDVLDSNQKLFPNMTSRVTIQASSAQNVMLLPLSTVRENSRGRFVYKMLPDGRAQELPVTVGLRGNEKIEIRSGVSEGEEIVLRPSLLTNITIISSTDTKTSAAASKSKNRDAGHGPGPRLF